MNTLFSLEGRVALVTGASRGLGFGMALGLARAGATLVLNGRDAATLALRRNEIEAAGGRRWDDNCNLTMANSTKPERMQ